MNPLIPNLPDDLALECLIRVPPESLPLLRQVSHHWKTTSESPLFHRLRRSSSSSHPLLIFSQSHLPKSSSSPQQQQHQQQQQQIPSFRLTSLHPLSSTFSPLPPLPFSLPLFCALASSSLHLLLIGGWDPLSFAPSNSLYLYSFLSASWRRAAPMPPPARSFFACAANQFSQLLVAGGHDNDKNALKSAMVYDLAKDEWTVLPDMKRERDECICVVIGGIFRVVSGYASSSQGRFERSAEVFDVGRWEWKEVEEDVEGGGECLKSCVVGGDGRMYVFGGNGGKVVVMVKEGGEWREVAELPEDVRVGAKMVAWGGSLVVVGMGGDGRGLAGYVLEKKQGSGMGWRRLSIPVEYSGHVQSVCCVDI